MKSNKFIKTFLIFVLIFSSYSALASSSKEMTLVGEIISFDKTHVRIKSGKTEYVFSKDELDHHSYAVGQRIEIPFDENKIKHAVVKGTKSIKK